jgi:hypothetical protein
VEQPSALLLSWAMSAGGPLAGHPRVARRDIFPEVGQAGKVKLKDQADQIKSEKKTTSREPEEGTA